MDTYRVKIKSDGTMDKLKVRIVVRGDLQRNFSNDDTWSPTASVRLLKVFLAHATHCKCRVQQLDFIGAFLQANVRERVFVKLPARYGDLFPEFAPYCGRPLRLTKSMYGMNYAGKNWWQDLSDWLLSTGFQASSVHPCLMWRKTNSHYLILLNYVNDMLYFSTDKQIETNFTTTLAQRFKVEFLGNAHWFLSLRINQLADYSIRVDQSRYAKAITHRYTNTLNTHLKPTYDQPLPSDWVPSKTDCSATTDASIALEQHYNLDYRSCTGALLYLNCTRPDIVFAVMKLVKFNLNPGRPHFEALIHLLGYIRDHSLYGLQFYSNTHDSPVYSLLSQHNITTKRDLFAFSDSSWQDCPDTGRSTGSFLIFYKGGVVDHSSFLPDPVAMSSGEAEYNTACATCIAVAHLRMLTNKLITLSSSDPPNQEPVTIILDNTAAIKMGQSFRDTRHTRHILRRYHYVRQGKLDGLHHLSWITNKMQLADNGTKPLTPAEALPRQKIFLVPVEV
ncbi:MAG: reverse transcriptase domain-containing protein [Gaiellaceae bacterium]